MPKQPWTAVKAVTDADCRSGKVCADMRMLAVFEKGERIRHIGHLDIQRSVQRGLRRSGLPVAYSQGFNPHILVTFASALSTGACGTHEIMDVTMAEEVEPEVFLNRMNRAMPPEMQISETRAVDNKHPSLMSMLFAAEYDLFVRNEKMGQVLSDSIPEMMACEHIFSIRKTKTKTAEVDIRPLILDLSGENGHIRAVLVLNEKESCKPQMLLDALKTQNKINDEIRMLITRERLFGKNENGELIPLEKL